MSGNPKTIVIASNQFDSIVVFRGALVRSLISKGNRVICLAPSMALTPRDYRQTLTSWGADVVTWNIAPTSLSPFGDLGGLLQLYRLLKTHAPTALLCYTIKPNLYCGLIGYLRKGIKIVALMNGLGFVFLSSSRKARLMMPIVRGLYKLSFRRAAKVFFHNQSDLDYFAQHGLVARSKAALVAGSGVDVNQFQPSYPIPWPPNFLLASRLVQEKGVNEFLEASRLVKVSFPAARFTLVGSPYSGPSSIPIAKVQSWVQDGIGEYYPGTSDLLPYYHQASVVVLPSYREGMSRFLLEGLACGRAVICSDTPGCREVVPYGENGVLVPVKNSSTLASVMQQLAADREKTEEMGRKGRILAESNFRVEKVVEQIEASLL